MDRFYDILEKHFGKIVGMILGLLFAVLVIAVGFWKTVFVLFCILLGYFFGKIIDNHEDLRSFLDRILPPGKM
ncbi:DUF2273 domain-containing protein [Calorimonas adulescens]|jgi:Small integral membrane protein (DUF2273).|uniref:DUF2273 domain-containing protein n=1 Tax=Calorimonas adulescens TaxID=2606906 RepID=A0A5D8QHT5_9THEO|nr:DUF2273 domain-containing protein [Calorimonas adulescens]TZE83446.1 DUF2273 domain-containing protein [Calorimonas adulescens]